ncbi:MAG: SPOR domain-containing protein [Pseudogulbenkiania sp.]|nr:SPOR domain-containing protein [Pseudogulbenkiania sp.]
MKWFLALVVVLNLAVALYGSLKQRPAVDIHAQEVSPEQLKLLPVGWVASASAVPTAEASTPGAQTALPASLDDKPAVAAAPAPAPAASKPAAAPVPEKAPPAKPEALACFQWGPLSDSQLARVRGRLASLHLAAGQLKEAQSSELRGSGKFWVYHPALATRAETQTLLAELKGKGFDGYIVQNDGYQGSVSLGLFGKEESAKALAAKAQAAGFAKVHVEPRGQQVTSTLLTLGSLTAEQAGRLAALQKRLAPRVALKACN